MGHSGVGHGRVWYSVSCHGFTVEYGTVSQLEFGISARSVKASKVYLTIDVDLTGHFWAGLLVLPLEVLVETLHTGRREGKGSPDGYDLS